MKLYLGGDVSKGYADWVILSDKKQIVLENFQLDDTYTGHCKLYSTDVYEKKLSEGMPKMAAIGVCMHKILRIIYGMLKHEQVFDPSIDKHNCERSKSKQQDKKLQESVDIDKSRRYQEFDATAPISGKQTKKRKEHDLSQCEITSQSTGSTCSSSTKL
jgi:hypothetical protein